jgi:hypothetical protein
MCVHMLGARMLRVRVWVTLQGLRCSRFWFGGIACANDYHVCISAMGIGVLCYEVWLMGALWCPGGNKCHLRVEAARKEMQDH